MNLILEPRQGQAMYFNTYSKIEGECKFDVLDLPRFWTAHIITSGIF